LTNATTALAVILLSRVLAGICGANITVAQACIADITPPGGTLEKKDGADRDGLRPGLHLVQRWAE
jgi:hypothetical protein